MRYPQEPEKQVGAYCFLIPINLNYKYSYFNLILLVFFLLYLVALSLISVRDIPNIRAIIIITIARTPIPITIPTGIHRGEVTHHQDQSIFPVSSWIFFSIINVLIPSGIITPGIHTKSSTIV